MEVVSCNIYHITYMNIILNEHCALVEFETKEETWKTISKDNHKNILEQYCVRKRYKIRAPS